MKNSKVLRAAAAFCLLATLIVFTSAKKYGSDEIKENAVLLNGNPLTTASIWLGSTGTLTVFDKNPATDVGKKILFRVSLMRGDMVIKRVVSDNGQQVKEVEISELLSFAKLGDEILVEPSDENREGTRRVFRVAQAPNLYWVPRNWFAVPMNGDGC
ncbi:hypothetical protein [Persicitalea sp.]|uniref:hypothetical protein n=1 Tax=Persicitalea sp. TaxID=3100273 RepID=UPI0035934038